MRLMKPLYRIALPLLLSIGFTGCEALTPNGQPKPKPIVTPDTLPQRVEIVVKVDGDGRIQLVGNSEIKLSNAQTSAEKCECGCGKDGCQCNQTQDLASKSGSMMPPDALSDRGHAGEIVTHDLKAAAKSDKRLTVLSFEGCATCDIAVADLRRLGFVVEKRMTDEAGTYPQIMNARGERYQPPIEDAVMNGRRVKMRFWRTGRDDVEAVRQLAK